MSQVNTHALFHHLNAHSTKYTLNSLTNYVVLGRPLKHLKRVTILGEREDYIFGRGNYFGERALLMNVTREYDFIVSSDEVELLALDREAFDNHLEKRLRDRLYSDMGIRVLQTVPLLSQLSATDQKKLLDAVSTEIFDDGTDIITQGEEGVKFYIIKEGTVDLIKDISLAPLSKVKITQLHNGDFFGEASLLNETVTVANCVAVGQVECYSLEKNTFLTLFSDLKRNFRTAIRKREQEINLKISNAALETTAFTLADLNKVQTIGKGSIGRVVLVQHKQLGTCYALKVLMKQRGKLCFDTKERKSYVARSCKEETRKTSDE